MSGLLPIIQADAQRIPLASESVQCCVTSPPYFGLRRYANCETLFGGDAGCEHVWTKAPPRRGGWDKIEFKDTIQAAHSGSHCALPETDVCENCGAYFGELGHETTPEFFVSHLVAIFREVRRVLRPDGCLWVVMGDSYAAGHVKPGGRKRQRAGKPGPFSTFTAPRMTQVDGCKPKDLVGVPWMLAFALRADGWWLRQDNIWAKPNPMPESVRDRTTRSHEYVFHFTKSAKYFYDADALKEPLQRAPHTGARKSIPPGSVRRDVGCGRESATWGKTSGANLRSVWRINTEAWPEAHFATFPREIARRCIAAGSAEGDVVLDPFCGSGTTVEVAYELRRIGVGLDLVWDYCKDHAAKRFRKGQAKGRQTVMAL